MVVRWLPHTPREQSERRRNGRYFLRFPYTLRDARVPKVHDAAAVGRALLAADPGGQTWIPCRDIQGHQAWWAWGQCCSWRIAPSIPQWVWETPWSRGCRRGSDCKSLDPLLPGRVSPQEHTHVIGKHSEVQHLLLGRSWLPSDFKTCPTSPDSHDSWHHSKELSRNPLLCFS